MKNVNHPAAPTRSNEDRFEILHHYIGHGLDRAPVKSEDNGKVVFRIWPLSGGVYDLTGPEVDALLLGLWAGRKAAENPSV